MEWLKNNLVALVTVFMTVGGGYISLTSEINSLQLYQDFLTDRVSKHEVKVNEMQKEMRAEISEIRVVDEGQRAAIGSLTKNVDRLVEKLDALLTQQQTK